MFPSRWPSPCRLAIALAVCWLPAGAAAQEMTRLPAASPARSGGTLGLLASAPDRPLGAGPYETGYYGGMDPPPDFDLPQYEMPPVDWNEDDGIYAFHLLPSDLIYKSYLAGAKESRLGAQIINEEHDGWLFDATLGGRIGLFRYGTRGMRPQGFQVDVEGSAQLRLDIPDDVDLRGVDFRAGVPLTYGWGQQQVKFGYYHLSSHTGDEYMVKHPSYSRINYARDVLVLGYSYYLTDQLRLYAEAGYAFYTKVSQPWEFQFGLDYAPARPTGLRGAPFFAFNGHLRDEVNFGGNLVVQAGWSWRSDENSRLLRIGLHYFNGESSQFSYFDDFEQQIGVGVWYDY